MRSSERFKASTASKGLRRRSHALSEHREYISAGESSYQLQSEIAHLDVANREDLLAQAELPITIPAEQVLAMKADLGIPWAKLRIVNR